MLSRFSRASGPQSGFRFLGKQPCFKAISCSFSTSKQEDEHERKDSINLRERFWTLPNIITSVRIVATPAIASLICYEHYQVAGALFVVAGVCDWLDGYLARKWNQQSVLGSILDPLADKVLIGTVSVALAYKGFLATPVVALVLCRDLYLMGYGFYKRAITKPKDVGFFDTTTAKVQIAPSKISKYNTAAQLAWIVLGLANAATSLPPLQVVSGLGWAVCATTAASWIGYLRKEGVQPLEKGEEGDARSPTSHTKKE